MLIVRATGIAFPPFLSNVRLIVIVCVLSLAAGGAAVGWRGSRDEKIASWPLFQAFQRWKVGSIIMGIVGNSLYDIIKFFWSTTA
jgi:hypothetical protein